jgi:hypothetical protein
VEVVAFRGVGGSGEPARSEDLGEVKQVRCGVVVGMARRTVVSCGSRRRVV